MSMRFTHYVDRRAHLTATRQKRRIREATRLLRHPNYCLTRIVTQSNCCFGHEWSQKVNFLGQGNKGGSSRLPLGEERANILLLACCYEEGRSPVQSKSRAKCPAIVLLCPSPLAPSHWL